MLVGRSGFLKVERPLLSDKRREPLEEFGAQVVNENIVIDGNIITSTSPATAIAFVLLEEITHIDNEIL